MAGGSFVLVDRDAASGTAFQEGGQIMSRIRILDQALWSKVPKEVIAEAEQAAQVEPCWIAMQGNGHVVAMDPPGSPDVATGDLVFIAEVAPARA